MVTFGIARRLICGEVRWFALVCAGFRWFALSLDTADTQNTLEKCVFPVYNELYPNFTRIFPVYIELYPNFTRILLRVNEL